MNKKNSCFVGRTITIRDNRATPLLKKKCSIDKFSFLLVVPSKHQTKYIHNFFAIQFRGKANHDGQTLSEFLQMKFMFWTSNGKPNFEDKPCQDYHA